MGNYRFRLSDMMPNAWFYKLKEMGKARNQNSATADSMKKRQPTSTTQLKPKQAHPRKSYYYTRDRNASSEKFYNSPANLKPGNAHFLEPPRKSSKQRMRNRRTSRSSPKLVSNSVSASCSCRATLWTKSDSSPPDYSASSSDSSPEFKPDHVLVPKSFDNMVSWSSTCSCRVNQSNPDDIVLDVDKNSFASNFGKLDEFDNIPELELRPIITKPEKFNDMVKDVMEQKESNEPIKYRRSSARFEETNPHGSLSVKVVKEERITVREHKTNPVKKSSVNSPGVRLRLHSPRIASRRLIQAQGRRSVSSSSSSMSSRRSLSDSLAIVKSSFDPKRDFRESMVEMIVENNIRASKDLEDLLACYLSLNSDEYHDIIINVFKQIWFDLTDLRLK